MSIHENQRKNRQLYNKKRSESCYGVWANVIQRCCNPKHPLYQRYGAKGIKVCKRWRSFENFIEDMGIRPDKTYSIDRINNQEGYYPSNCRWATKTLQSVNRRTQSNNTSGYKGVNYDRSRGKWMVMFQLYNKQQNLGRFDTIEEAISMRLFAECEYHGELI